MNLIKRFTLALIPKEPILGRWKIKHDINKCETYMKNYYGEPGYPNQYKNIWIKNIIEKDKNYNNVR